MRSQGKTTATQITNYRKSQLTGAETHDNKLLPERVPGISYLSFIEKKNTRHTKRPKRQFGEPEEASEESDSDVAGMFEI